MQTDTIHETTLLTQHARPADLPLGVREMIARLDRLDSQAAEFRRCAESIQAIFDQALLGF